MAQKSSPQEVRQQLEQIDDHLERLRSMLGNYDPEIPPDRIDARWIAGILEARQRRDDVFGAGLFSDPAWDYLLSVYSYQLAGETCTITDASRRARISFTTGLRWVSELEKKGLVERQAHSSDKRLVLMRLSTKGIEAMERYFGKQPRAGEGL